MKEGSISDRLARFFFSYRITPHSTTGASPAELMFGRNLHSRFDQVQPNVSMRVQTQQEQQKRVHNNNACIRTFEEGESVSVCNFWPGRPWIPGHVVRLSGPVSLVVKLTNGYVVKHHQDHIRKRSESTESSDHETLPEPVNDTAVPVPDVVGTEEDSVPCHLPRLKI